MKYNIYKSLQLETVSLHGLTIDQVNIAVNAYLNGNITFTISGKTHSLKKVEEFKIFEIDPNITEDRISKVYDLHVKKGLGDERWITPLGLSCLGKEVTDEFLKNMGYGELKSETSSKPTIQGTTVITS